MIEELLDGIVDWAESGKTTIGKPDAITPEEAKAKLLEALEACKPEEKQQKYMQENAPITKDDETRCRFYRYGGYDSAIRQYHSNIRKLFEVEG